MSTMEERPEDLEEWLALVARLRDGLPPQMAERFAAAVGQRGPEDANLAELMKTASTHQPVLTTVMEQLNAWEESGTLQAFAELAEFVVALKRSQTPAMAERIGSMISDVGQVTAQLTHPEMQQLLARLSESGPALSEMMDQLTQWQAEGTFRTLAEMVDFFGAVRRSLTAPMVERVGTLMSQLGVLTDQATDPGMTALLGQLTENHEAVSTLIQQVGEWQRDGTWSVLVEAVVLMRSFRDSISPEMIARVTAVMTQGAQLLDATLRSGALSALERFGEQAALAMDEARNDNSRVTLGSMYRSLKDPEVQLGLKTLMALVKRVPMILTDN